MAPISAGETSRAKLMDMIDPSPLSPNIRTSERRAGERTLSADDLVMKKAGRKRGRPSTYSVEVMEVICERLVYGESLRQICCDETMPGRRTVFQWLEKHPEFTELYTAAREAQIDHMLGENVEIADTDPIVERARLRINGRLAWLAKLHARKYR
jgi:hypothetical protein